MASYKLPKQVTLLLVSLLFLGYGAAAQSPPSGDPYRTAYHFQPRKNWINDPNGPMLYKGIYHLFYQYNPNGVVWGPPVWGHSTSTDLVNWTPQPLTMEPEMASNINGSWSGSATILPGNKPAILFTGLDPKYEQVQVLAYPKNIKDPYLKQWFLAPQNPVMFPTPQNQINATSFRDPTTAWMLPDGRWRVLVGSKRGQRGLSLLFRSKDFVHWVQAKHPLYSYKLSGMWECPDFFPVYANGNTMGVDTSIIGRNIKHVLKVSLDISKHDVYTIGGYNTTKDAYTPDVGYMNESSLRYDYGKYYASKTFFDYAKKERILLGWANESSSVEYDIKKGWSGIHTIPRRIWLDKSVKQLIQWPISNIEKLRQNPVKLYGKLIKGGSLNEVTGITAAQADVEVLFKIKDLKHVEKFDASWTDPQLLCSKKGASVKGGLGPFGLMTLASKGLKEYTAVFFRIFKAYDNKFVVLMCSDQSRSSLNPTNDKTTYGTFVDVNPVLEGLSLRVLIDHSVVESFGAKGKNVITSRVYPTLAINEKAHLYVFNKGTSDVEITGLTAWSMKKASIA
ncbi:fructan 6-exohydrolase-like [Chenopodium quinoa]|uniref:fructan 6-exohydrolase-like n=1 Tax=Chenopodium quinoa TaxID=63459 RepID=UPI000B78775C|nr:fructan 6-exohydrolase-like [Chenopodium quinoa]